MHPTSPPDNHQHFLSLNAPAKVNLSLEIVGQRPDGYHDLISVMQTVGVYDTLTAHLAPSLAFTCSDERLVGDHNIVLTAMRRLHAAYPPHQSVKVHLEKRIPVAAGLGGGSSDAAAALVAVARLWKLDLTCPDLLTLAADLGSDVPFFLYGGTALVEGRGERVESMSSRPTGWCLLVKPPIDISTAAVFRALPSSEWTDGRVTGELASHMRTGGNAEIGVNSLQKTVFRLYPAARECFDRVESVAHGRTILSGSGPTIVSLFSSEEEGMRARSQLTGYGYWSALTRTVIPPLWQTPCS